LGLQTSTAFVAGYTAGACHQKVDTGFWKNEMFQNNLERHFDLIKMKSALGAERRLHPLTHLQKLEIMPVQNTWMQIRAAYEGSREPVHKIARRYRVGLKTIYKRIELEGWRTRNINARTTNNLATLARLRRMVVTEVDLVEKDLSGSEGLLPLADRERLTKVMAGVIKLMEGIADLEQRFNKISEDMHADTEQSNLDDDAMRESIAQRIDRMRKQHGTQGDN
jgi:hypothetical protein